MQVTEKVNEYFNRLVSLYQEIELLNNDVKEIKSELKELDIDATLIGRVAKAKAREELTSLEDSSKALLDLISEVAS